MYARAGIGKELFSMTLQELYAAIGGDYKEVRVRLPSDKFIQKFVLKFLDDKSYELLVTSLEQGNGEEAFRAAHTIKGMCQNLGFTTLLESSSRLTEALRGGLSPEAVPLAGQVKLDYEMTVSAIRSFQEGLPT